jgi:hypothetical protein
MKEGGATKGVRIPKGKNTRFHRRNEELLPDVIPVIQITAGQQCATEKDIAKEEKIESSKEKNGSQRRAETGPCGKGGSSGW